MEEQVFVYEDFSFLPVSDFSEAPKVADSFLVVDGRVRSLDRHMERFNTSVAKHLALNTEIFWHVKVLGFQESNYPELLTSWCYGLEPGSTTSAK